MRSRAGHASMREIHVAPATPTNSTAGTVIHQFLTAAWTRGSISADTWPRPISFRVRAIPDQVLISWSRVSLRSDAKRAIRESVTTHSPGHRMTQAASTVRVGPHRRRQAAPMRAPMKRAAGHVDGQAGARDQKGDREPGDGPGQHGSGPVADRHHRHRRDGHGEEHPGKRQQPAEEAQGDGDVGQDRGLGNLGGLQPSGVRHGPSLSS